MNAAAASPTDSVTKHLVHFRIDFVCVHGGVNRVAGDSADSLGFPVQAKTEGRFL